MAPKALIAMAAGVFLLVVVLYLPTLRGGFTYDSIAQVLQGDYLHQPGNWAEVLSLRVLARDELDRNRPLLLASLMADAAWSGRSPGGFRLSSVLLHALNAALLATWIALAFRREKPTGVPAFLAAGFGALLFALHPLVVEAVAEPSNREDVLVLLAILPGLLVLILAAARPAPVWWKVNLVLALCCLLAVMAKESGVAAPVIFVAAAWVHLGRGARRCLPGLAAGAAAVGLFLLASYGLRPQGSAIFTYDPPPLADGLGATLAVQARIWTLQLGQIAGWSGLSAHYEPGVLRGQPAFLPPLVLGLVLSAVVVAARRSALVLLGAIVFAAALLPASNMVPQFQPVADRYLYVPLAGVGMIAAAGLALAGRAGLPQPALVAGALALAVLVPEYAGNLRRQVVWQSPENLWSDVLRTFPDNPAAHLGLANARYRRGDYAEAAGLSRRAIELSRGQWDDPVALLALCLWQSGARGEAAHVHRELLRLWPRYGDLDRLARSLAWSPGQLQVLQELATLPAPPTRQPSSPP